MEDEMIDIFDSENRPLNIVKPKSEAYKRGLWHRTAHIWIYNSKNEILLQLRSKSKVLWPGKWDISAAGHVSAGEQPLDSARRELKEELGIKTGKQDIEFYETKKLKSVDGDIINNEIIYVYIMKFNKDISRLKIQEEELDQIQFFSADNLKKEYLRNPDKFTPGQSYWMEMIAEIKKKQRKN